MNIDLQDVALPLRLRTATPMSDDELMRFCTVNEMLRVEREPNGELLVMTPAGNRSSHKNAAIISALYQWAERDGRGYAFDSNTGFNLGDGSMRSPDAAWVSAARWDSLSEEDKERFSPICPEFVIELRSAADRLAPLEVKMEQWMANSVELAWMIDPQRKVVAIYRPGAETEILTEPAAVAGGGPVAGFELTMDRIWN